MLGGTVLGMIVGVVIGLMFAVDSRNDRANWRRAVDKHQKQVFFGALHNTSVCKDLAVRLEIEGDADEVADFVKQQVQECWREIDKIRC